MSSSKFKHSLKEKSILTFLIVCSLFMSEKALAVWDETCCKVRDHSDSSHIKENSLEIYFKFFHHGNMLAMYNFLYLLNISYSTDGGNNYEPLMSAGTIDQLNKTWAEIYLYRKQPGTKIDVFYHPKNNQSGYVGRNWGEDDKTPKFEVSNEPDPKINNQTWFGLIWNLKPDQRNTTHVRFEANWRQIGKNRPLRYVVVHKVNPGKAKLNSNSLNFSNSSPEQEIRTEAKDNAEKAYKEANAIVVKGALNENILVYTTLGKLVKSMVADCDVLQIPVPANQVYIVNVGQSRYKVAL